MKEETLSRPLLVARSLTKTYGRGAWWQRGPRVHALRNVSLIVRAGRTVALVGKSGSGKTTLAMCLAALDRPDQGEIWFEGSDLARLAAQELKPLLPKVHLILQDSTAALNPRWMAREIIEEPLRIQARSSAAERRETVDRLMKRVGLLPDWQHRRPAQLSGGQRQRLAIARALARPPKLLILDEPFTGLDASIRGQIVNLLLELQAEYAMTYLLVSHDLRLARHLADEIAVMEAGRIVECEHASRFREGAEGLYRVGATHEGGYGDEVSPLVH